MSPEEIEALGLQVGDEVRVTFRAKVDTMDSAHDVLVRPGRNSWGLYLHTDIVLSAEKIVPPFKPGDVIRSRHTGVYYLLGERGFLNMATGKTYPYTQHRAGAAGFSHSDHVLAEAP